MTAAREDSHNCWINDSACHKRGCELVARQLDVNRAKGAVYLTDHRRGTTYVDTLTPSIDVSNILFQSTRADYMEALLTRRHALDAEIELIQTTNGRARTMVSVFRGLVAARAS